MGNILSAIHDDIDEYLDLCRRYGEDARYSDGSPHCYGAHASALRARFEKESRTLQTPALLTGILIHDQQAYEENCRKQGEAVRFKDGAPDCYGDHSRQLAAAVAVEDVFEDEEAEEPSEKEILMEFLEYVVEMAGTRDATIHLQYSGRGMYRAHCVGISCANLTWLLNYLCEYGCTEQTLRRLLRLVSDVCEDNLGLGQILYWPGIQHT